MVTKFDVTTDNVLKILQNEQDDKEPQLIINSENGKLRLMKNRKDFKLPF